MFKITVKAMTREQSVAAQVICLLQNLIFGHKNNIGMSDFGFRYINIDIPKLKYRYRDIAQAYYIPLCWQP
jgi:hypothetical protein